MKKIGVLIYTYNKVDDARINMEIIRTVWRNKKLLNDIEIVHSYNGEAKWYPKKYIENILVRSKNTWHFQGAADLIDKGINKFSNKVDYVVVVAADTWLINPSYIENIILKMIKNNYLLATCSWGLVGNMELRKVGMATDFFIVNLKWAKKNTLFPINYGQFHKKYKDLFLYISGGNVMLEKLMLTRFIEAVGKEQNFKGSAIRSAFEKILIMKEREPVHSGIRKNGDWERKMYWEKIGLLTHHEPLSKKKILKSKRITDGNNIKKLLNTKDVNYFNNGQRRSKLSSN